VLHKVERGLRDLSWQPERFLEAGPADDLLEEKRRLISSTPTSRHDRLARYRAIRALNDLLAPGVQGLRADLEAERQSITATLHDDAVARSRDYPIVLYDEDRIRPAMTAIARAVGA
jgi:hypothetical protein